MLFYFFIVIFIFGLFIGSFLNCVIYRLSVEKSFLKGRSFCPDCHHTLGWFDLIPVFSFLFLGGKCRYCGKKISWQYPAVEVATGLLLLLIFNFQFSIFNEAPIFQFSNIVNLIYFWVIACFLEIIFIYDLKHYIIPDQAIYPAIIITLLYKFIENFSFNTWNFFRISDFGFRIFNSLTVSLLSGAIAALFFFLIWFVSRGRWMGFGDVKLALFMGLFLGPSLTAVALFTAFLSGAIIGLVLVALRKKGLKSEVPFGPFLITGTFVALFFGQILIRWYLNFLRV